MRIATTWPLVTMAWLVLAHPGLALADDPKPPPFGLKTS